MQLYLLLVLESVALLRRALDSPGDPFLRAASRLALIIPAVNAWTVWIFLAAIGGFDPREPLPGPAGTLVVAAVTAAPVLLAGIAAAPVGNRHVLLAQQLGLSAERMANRARGYWLFSALLFILSIAFFSVWKSLQSGRG